MAPKQAATRQPTRRSERVQVANALLVSKKELESRGVKKRRRFHRPKQRIGCKFLRLPGELRNQIYRYAVVETYLSDQRGIELTPQGPGEPALLRVCKSVRREARSIYYTENKFVLKVHNYNGAAFAPFGRQYYGYGRLAESVNVSFILTGIPVWDNLVAWVKADRNWDFDLMPEMRSCPHHADFVIGGIFKLAASLRCTPWSVVEKALEAMRYSLKGTCSRWWADEDFDEDDDF